MCAKKSRDNLRTSDYIDAMKKPTQRKKQDDSQIGVEMADALAQLRKLKAASSVTKMVDALQNTQGFSDINRTTIFRWLNNSGSSKRHADTVTRIISAAKVLSAYQRSPITIRFAAIKHATEMLPVHLLRDLPEVTKAIKIDIQYKDSINDCFVALETGSVDIVVAPRKECGLGDPIQRLCKLVEVPIGGIFPGKYDKDKKSYTPFSDADELAKSLKQEAAINREFTLGFLPNADYRSVLQSFLSNYGVLPSTLMVLDYNDAFKKLKCGAIHGVIGHSVFVANCYRAVTEHRNASGNPLKNLQILRPSPNNSFGCVKMDIFVNVVKIDCLIARKALGILHEVIEYIKHHKKDHALADKVSAMLKLEKAPAKSGMHILDEYSYEVKTFVTDTLLKLWK